MGYWEKIKGIFKLLSIIITNKNNFVTDEIVGMKFNLLSNKWSKSNDTSVNYISTFLKN